nr:TetR/AcrR family transcriptional regulator [Diaminobutyricibacter tongyongensis]
MTPEARRAEIVETAHQVIAEKGYRSLSLRAVATRCGMSAPGLMYYFPDMQSLLEAVLEHRDEVDIAAIVPEDLGEQSFADLIDAAAAYYVERVDDQRSFDALEAEALDPNHPAHSWFAARNARNIELLRPVIEREFADPDTAMRMLRYLFDGLRLNWLRNPDTRALFEDVHAVRSFLLNGLERKVPAAG